MAADYDSLEQALVVGRDWSIDVALTQPATRTHATRPATGLTLTAFAAQTAAAISGTSATVAELASEPGTYRISIDGAAITTGALGTDGAVVYVSLYSGSKLVKQWKVYFYTTDRIS